MSRSLLSSLSPRRSSRVTSSGEPKSTHSSPNPSFVDSADDATDEVWVKKDAVMSPFGVTFNYLLLLSKQVQSGEAAPDTKLVVLEKDITVMLSADGATRLLKAGYTTAKIISEESNTYSLKVAYVPELVECPVADTRMKQRDEWTVEDICEQIVKPATMPTKSFYHECIAEKHRGPAYKGAFVSQSRSTPFILLLDALWTHFGTDADPTKCYVWLDLFSANQPLLTSGAEAEEQEMLEWILKNGLHEMIGKFEETVLVLASWQHAAPLKRAWCLWELYGSVVNRADGFKITLPQSEMDKFEEVLREDYGSMADAAIDVDVREANCNVEKDRIMIMKQVGDKTELVNTTVQNFLRDWFVRTGQAHVVRRLAEPSTANTVDTASLMRNLGRLLHDQNKYDEAEGMYMSAVKMFTAVDGPDSEQMAMTLNDLGRVYLTQGRYDQAEVMCLASLNIRRKTNGPDHPEIATTENNLGTLYKKMGKFEQAEKMYNDALRIKTIRFGSKHETLAPMICNLADLYEKQGKYKEAADTYANALQIFEDFHGPNHLDVALVKANLADVYRIQHKFEMAEAMLVDAMRIRKAAFGPNHPQVALTANNFGSLYAMQGRFAEAEALFEEVLGIYKQVHGPEHAAVAMATHNFGSLYLAQGKLEQAEPMFLDALRVKRAVYGPNHPELTSTQSNLGAVYATQGKTDEAVELWLDALRIFETTVGIGHPNAIAIQENLKKVRG